jgi:hypothetical protein
MRIGDYLCILQHRRVLERRSRKKPAKLRQPIGESQSEVINAHINHDLAIALDRIAALDGRFTSREGA